MLVLGIESSCDDTSAAIVTSDRKILSNIIINQNTEHAPYKGVVPEIAARAHLGNIEIAIRKALDEASINLNDIDAIAATTGPGLIGGVIVGTMVAKGLCMSLGKPFLAINHLEGHALTARLTNDIPFPYLLLLASGGHCQFIKVSSLGKYQILGQTLDDAVGESFDKVAKMLNLGYPGGPIIEKLAKLGKVTFDFPRPMLGRSGCDMSFSGLKTAVRREIELASNIDDEFILNIAASFQTTVSNVLKNRASNAIFEFKKEFPNSKHFVLAGGVAANQFLRQELNILCVENNMVLTAPPMNLCTDNAAMIAWAGIERFQKGYISNLEVEPQSRWSLESLS